MLAAASSARALEAFETALGRATARAARRSRAVIAGAVVEVELDDPIATVFALRMASEEWFCWSEADRDFELATLGATVEVVGRGSDRFGEVARACDEILREAEVVVADSEGGHDLAGQNMAGAGPVWVGGFAFADDGGRSSHWSSFEPGSMTLPELSLARRAGRTLLTLTGRVGGEGGAEAALAKARSRLGQIGEATLPLLDPHRTARPDISGPHSPQHFERAVGEAIRRMAARREGLDKVVLAREVTVSAPAAHDPAALFGALRDGFPNCFCFCRGTREGAFLGASPELLVRRSGASAATVALAGSTRRSSDPALDDHLGEMLLQSEKDRLEHEIVADRIKRSLRPASVWVEAAKEPELIRVANIQHLATPIAAQLRQAYSAVEIAGMLHPTPAVGGEPWPLASTAIEDLEQIDRGWYAGPVGWMDAADDGEFCVALRSALLRDRVAHLYAGVGIVPGSEPAAELAETETKLGALLPLLTD